MKFISVFKKKIFLYFFKAERKIYNRFFYMAHLTLNLSIRVLANTNNCFAQILTSGYSDYYKLPVFISAIMIKYVCKY